MSVVNGLKWVCIVLLLTGCAMALSACGGGDDSDSDDTPDGEDTDPAAKHNPWLRRSWSPRRTGRATARS